MSKNFKLSLHNGVRIININRPEACNAFNIAMYYELLRIINLDANNDDVRVSLVIGTGNYFSSGNDFKLVLSGSIDLEIVSENFEKIGRDLINYPKVLIAVVNGPAIGFAAAFLGLFDVVYASDRATFLTPFVQYGLCPDGGFSYTFPRTLGRFNASGMALLGKTITAQEAFEQGLVAKVIPHEQLPEFIQSLHSLGNLPLNTLMVTKALLMAPIKVKLHEANKREFVKLRELFNSPEIFDIVQAAFSKRSKL